MTATENNGLPTTEEEIKRKTFAALERLEWDLERGAIGKDYYKYALDILWDAVSGLVDDQITAIFGAMGNKCREATYSHKRIFRNPQTNKCVKIMDSRTGAFTFVQYVDDKKDAKLFDYRQEPNPCIAAKSKIESLVVKLLTNGYVEL